MAECCGSHVVAACAVPAEQLPKLLSNLHKYLEFCAEQRSKYNKKGHARSPAFVEAALWECVKVMPELPKQIVTHAGDSTDVGRHTGRERYDTAWPLVREVLRVGGWVLPLHWAF